MTKELNQTAKTIKSITPEEIKLDKQIKKVLACKPILSRILAEVYGKTIPVFSMEIPTSVRAAEISSVAKSIFDYDPKGKVAQAYMTLTREVLAHGC